MSEQKTAKTMVFLPTDIFICSDPGNGSPIVAVYHDGRYRVWSKGKLERAMKLGYSCIVLLPQAAIQERDSWWLKILDVGKGQTVDMDNDMFSLDAMKALTVVIKNAGAQVEPGMRCWHGVFEALRPEHPGEFSSMSLVRARDFV